MDLKRQDIILLIVLLEKQQNNWSYANLAQDIGLSTSQLHSAVKRCLKAGLLTEISGKPKPIKSHIKEFLIHAVKYLCPPQKSDLTRGLPTAWAAAPLKKQIRSAELPPVWPDPLGEVRGIGFEPIHKSALNVAKKNSAVYEMLSLVDAIRAGTKREQELAAKIIGERLKS